MPGKNPLIGIGDEDRMRIPKHCLAKADASFQLHQAVIRRTPGKTFYAYDSALIQELEGNSPIQLSFLYLHEWLRDFTSDANSLTMANQLLHSSRWLTQDCNAFGRTMAGLGVQIPGDLKCYEGSYTDLDENGFRRSGSILCENIQVKFTSDTTMKVTGKCGTFLFKCDDSMVCEMKNLPKWCANNGYATFTLERGSMALSHNCHGHFGVYARFYK